MRSEQWSNPEDLRGEVIHAMASGVTGCGKTQAFMLPMLYRCIELGESAVVIDAKDGELFRNLSPFAEKHRQIIYDLSNPGLSPETWSPIQEGYSLSHSNQLTDRDLANELLADLAGAICSTEGSHEVYWPLSASNLFTGVVGALYELAPSDEYANLNSVSNILSNLDKRYAMSTLGKELAGLLAPNTPAKHYLDAYNCGTTDTRASTLTTASQHLYNICGKSEGLMRFLSTSSVRYSELDYNQPTIIWIILSEHSSASYHALGGLLVNYIAHELIRVAQKSVNQRLPIRFNVFVDEAGVTKVPSLKMLTACGRSRGIRMLLALQDPIAQLTSLYGPEDASSILSNISTQFIFANNSLATLQYYSQFCGETLDENTGGYQLLLSVCELFSMPPGRALVLHTGGFKSIIDLPFFYKVMKNRLHFVLPSAPRPYVPPKVFDLEQFITQRKRDKVSAKSEPAQIHPPLGASLETRLADFKPKPTQVFEGDDTPELPDLLDDFEHIKAPKSIEDMLREIDDELTKLAEEEKRQKEEWKICRVTVSANKDNAETVAFMITATCEKELDRTIIRNLLQTEDHVDFYFPQKEAEKIVENIRAVGGDATVSETEKPE